MDKENNGADNFVYLEIRICINFMVNTVCHYKYNIQDIYIL